jgi:hypothetical protein
MREKLWIIVCVALTTLLGVAVVVNRQHETQVVLNIEYKSNSKFPNEKFGLSTLSYQHAISDISSDERDSIPILANSFSKVASQIEHEGLNGVKNILDATKRENKGVKNPDELLRWHAALMDEVYNLYMTKQLNTNQDWARAWNEVAEGLRAVK